MERHRLAWLYLSERTDLLDGRPKRVLHVAPEPQLARLIRRVPGIDYLSGDLHDPSAMVRLDVTDIEYPDDSFDVVYCSHVLEHVQDDRRAMAEILRVLKPDGWAILQVPITAERTLEDPAVTTPEERLRVYGQVDHVRRYGGDYPDRLAAAGFDVTVDEWVRGLDAEKTRRYGLDTTEAIHLCRKPAGAPVPAVTGTR